MPIEKLNLKDVCIKQNFYSPFGLAINELIDAVNDIRKDIAANALNILKLKTRLDDHINPDVILPRFKEELLKCLEDDEFRVKMQMVLGLPIEELSTNYATTAGTPVDIQYATSGYIQAVDANKTILKPYLNPEDMMNARINDTANKTAKLKEAEDALALSINKMLDFPFLSRDLSNLSNFSFLRRDLLEAYKNWKEVRGK